MYEYELEGELEFEGELEWEGEGEWEGEAESEEFFRRIGALARRAASSPALRQVALRAARGALSGLGGVGGALGGAVGGTRGAALGRGLGSVVGRNVSGWLPQRELEGEFELEFEGEEEVNPIRRVYPDALMEHLGHAAAEAESEEEAEAFIGALVPLAARLLPRAASTVMRVAPSLIRGVAGATRALRSNPATRPMVRALPAVVRQTAANLARQAAQGRPVTPQTAVRTLARQTASVLGSPQRCAQAFQRSRALDQRYHRAAGPVASATGRAAGGARAAARPTARPAAGVCSCRQAAGGVR
jgi:hypothetical protein